MKVSLVVLSEGKASGKTVPIPVSPFLVGRGPQCHLRPASTLVSERHCALVVKDGRAFLRDFGSAGGSFVNDRKVTGEHGLMHDDVLTVGPLRFRLVIDRASEAEERAARFLSPADDRRREVETGSRVGTPAAAPGTTGGRKRPCTSSAAAAELLSQYLRRDRN
jgi:pSer/pThr/pTyr-binding forkhead associated (FHA) protein